MAPHEQEEHVYHPRDAVGQTVKATMVTGTAGLFVSTIQNTLAKQNVGAFGIFSRSGGTIAVFAAMGGAYEFVKSASANLREKDDSWNSAWGGFAAGSMLGLRLLGYGTALASILGVFAYTGGRLGGYVNDPEVDEVVRKEYLRKNRRRPVEETVEQLGEGRGIQGPGYEARRTERIKQAYGIDVPVHSRTAS